MSQQKREIDICICAKTMSKVLWARFEKKPFSPYLSLNKPNPRSKLKEPVLGAFPSQTSMKFQIKNQSVVVTTLNARVLKGQENPKNGLSWADKV